LLRIVPIANGPKSAGHKRPLQWLERHHDLAEVSVGFHVLERTSDLGERIDLVDRQLQFSRFHGRPDVLGSSKISRISAIGGRKVTPIYGCGGRRGGQEVAVGRRLTDDAAFTWSREVGLATLPETWSTVRSTPSPSPSHLIDPAGIAESTAKSAIQPAARLLRPSTGDHDLCALNFTIWSPSPADLNLDQRPGRPQGAWCPALCIVAGATGGGGFLEIRIGLGRN
jgi:hypothetical protein